MRTLNIDMDGVVVDFDKGFAKQTGMDFYTSRWHLLKSSRVGFYANLPRASGLQKFLAGVVAATAGKNIQVRFLTALPSQLDFPLIVAEKQFWVRENCNDTLPEGVDSWQVAVANSSADKHTFCTPGDILIDDNVLNVAQWSKAGGVALHHHNLATSLKWLEELLK